MVTREKVREPRALTIAEGARNVNSCQGWDK
jgi:hypothetical protein